MKSKAHSAIETAATAAGATSITQDGNVTVVDYNGSTIRISMMMGVETGWRIEVNGVKSGSEKAPSKAFKQAAKIIDGRRAREAGDLAGIHAVAADKGADIVSIEDGRVVLSYEGHEVVAFKPGLLWAVTCDSEKLSHSSMNAWSVLRRSIEALEERIHTAADLAMPADETRETLPLVVKENSASLLVLTLGADRVKVQVHIEGSEDALDFAFLRAEHELSEIADETVTLQRVGDHDEGDGVLRAYRMPRGDYCADDVEAVLRTGVEVGRYRAVTEDERMQAELMEGLAGQCHEEADVQDGIATVRFFDAPGTPAGWSAGLAATDEQVFARFDHEDGREERVAWWPSHPEEEELGIEDFLRSPASWSEHMWRLVECRAPKAMEDLDRRRALAFEDGERWVAGGEPEIGDDSREYARVLEKRHGLLKGDGLRAMRGKFTQPEAAA